jgi:gamma-glutamyltranspeptidase/glutathione hydrolase
LNRRSTSHSSTFARAISASTFVLLTGCGGNDLGGAFNDAPVATAPQIEHGTQGIVSSAHPLATQAGRQMLEIGGNAADAAVATAFTLAVVESSMSGIGGRAQILLRTPEGDYHGIDAQTELSAAYSAPWLLLAFSGMEIVGTPGFVAGMVDLQQTWGALPLATVLEPAIAHARNGYRLLPGAVARQTRAESDFREDPTLAAIYLQDGNVRKAGELFQQLDLADTLTAIAAGGHDAFYQGEIAGTINEDMALRGGPVRAADLAGYQAKAARLVQTTYRGYQITSLAGPANGTAIIAALNILAPIDVANLSEAGWLDLMGQTLKLVMQATVFDDPDDNNYQDTISARRADEFRQQLRLPEARGSKAASQSDKHRVQQLAMRASEVDWAGLSNGAHSHHTSHHVAADANGMMVSITQTLGPNMGAKVMTPGLGFLWAQTGGMPRWLSDAGPGDRPRTNIAPTLISKDGKPLMALGAAGGLMIPPAVLQVLSRVLDQGMDLADAIAAPRIAPKMRIIPPGYVDDALLLETTPINGWSSDRVLELAALGLEVEERPRYASFGRVHALMFDAASLVWTGVADPDWEGSAAAAGFEVAE